MTTFREIFTRWEIPLPSGGLWKTPSYVEDPDMSFCGEPAEDSDINDFFDNDLYLVSNEKAPHLELAHMLEYWENALGNLKDSSGEPAALRGVRRLFAFSLPGHLYAFLPLDEKVKLEKKLKEAALEAFLPYQEDVLLQIGEAVRASGCENVGVGEVYALPAAPRSHQLFGGVDTGSIALSTLFPLVLEDFEAPGALSKNIFLLPGFFRAPEVEECVSRIFGLRFVAWSPAEPTDNAEFFETLKVFGKTMAFNEAVQASRMIAK